MMNENQPTLNTVREEGLALPLMEDFYTIQGEGYNSGKSAYFLRLGGCDVGCHWCDVKESWDPDAHPVVSVEEMVKRVKSTPAEAVVITGGEPAMYPLNHLTRQLQQAGLKTWIETSGAHPLTGQWDWVCLSPKKFKPALSEVHQQADELKVVIFHPSDLAWAEEHAQRVKKECLLYLQPEWSRSETILPLIVEYAKANPQWNISLQTHKFMDIP